MEKSSGAKPASAASGGFSEQGLAQRSKSVAANAAATDFGHRKSYTPGFSPGPLFVRLFPFATANRFSDLTETALSFSLSASEVLMNYL